MRSVLFLAPMALALLAPALSYAQAAPAGPSAPTSAAFTGPASLGPAEILATSEL